MTCKDCYWYKQETALSQKRLCCNKNSKYYNQVLSEEVEIAGCKCAETKQAVDYREMTAWQFAAKYYM